MECLEKESHVSEQYVSIGYEEYTIYDVSSILKTIDLSAIDLSV